MDLEVSARQTLQTILGGGVALVPTAVGYGLVAIHEPGLRRIYELKGRPASKPCVTVATPAIAERLAHLPPALVGWLGKLAATTSLAIIAPLDAAEPLHAARTPFVRDQTTTNDTIALLYGAGPLVERIAELAFAERAIVVGSSANASGTGNNYALDGVPQAMRTGVDHVVDIGPIANPSAPLRPASTILDLQSGTFLRRGIAFERIAAAWELYRRAVSDKENLSQASPEHAF